MSKIKRISIKEFREFGFLHEANRLFFHPLGLALEVIVDNETGEERFGGVWDCRDDPEGIRFAIVNLEKAARIASLARARSVAREKLLGYVIQPAIESLDREREARG